MVRLWVHRKVRTHIKLISAWDYIHPWISQKIFQLHTVVHLTVNRMFSPDPGSAVLVPSLLHGSYRQFLIFLCNNFSWFLFGCILVNSFKTRV